MDNEVAVRDHQRPVNAARVPNIQPGKPIGSFSEFHRERVTGLLDYQVANVTALAATTLL